MAMSASVCWPRPVGGAGPPRRRGMEIVFRIGFENGDVHELMLAMGLVKLVLLSRPVRDCGARAH